MQPILEEEPKQEIGILLEENWWDDTDCGKDFTFSFENDFFEKFEQDITNLDLSFQDLFI